MHPGPLGLPVQMHPWWPPTHRSEERVSTLHPRGTLQGSSYAGSGQDAHWPGSPRGTPLAEGKLLVGSVCRPTSSALGLVVGWWAGHSVSAALPTSRVSGLARMGKCWEWTRLRRCTVPVAEGSCLEVIPTSPHGSSVRGPQKPRSACTCPVVHAEQQLTPELFLNTRQNPSD